MTSKWYFVHLFFLVLLLILRFGTAAAWCCFIQPFRSRKKWLKSPFGNIGPCNDEFFSKNFLPFQALILAIVPLVKHFFLDETSVLLSCKKIFIILKLNRAFKNPSGMSLSFYGKRLMCFLAQFREAKGSFIYLYDPDVLYVYQHAWKEEQKRLQSIF